MAYGDHSEQASPGRFAGPSAAAEASDVALSEYEGQLYLRSACGHRNHRPECGVKP